MSVNLNVIQNYIYFYHVDKFCLLPLYPDELTDSMQSTFQATNALARSAPVQTYSNSGPRTINLNFTLHRDMMNDLNNGLSNILDKSAKAEDNRDYIDTLVRYLQSIALPRYKVLDNKTKSVTPPMIAVRLGEDIFIKGIVNGAVQVTYKKPIMSDGKYAVVAINFTVTEVDPFDADYVASNGSFRSLTAGFDINRTE